ncbi:MAG: 4Fe-4S binding protein, partial [Clostridia bacterium]|nr:4Fe-4S binding protein [Clostridia bacterium]
HCPAEALQVVDKKAKLKQSKCIRCYCCQELCPFDAVQLKKTFMYRVLHTFSHTRNKK